MVLKHQRGNSNRTQKTKLKILTAAKKVFLEKGFKETTVTLIAKEANIGYGTVYSHFPSGKDGVLLHMMEEVMNHFYQIAELDYTPKNKTEAYQFTLKNTINFLTLAVKHQQLLTVVHEAIGMSTLIRLNWDNIIEKFIERVSKNVMIVKEMNLMHTIDYDPKIVAGSLIYPGEKFLWKIVLHGTDKPVEEIAQTIAGIYTHGLFK